MYRYLLLSIFIVLWGFGGKAQDGVGSFTTDNSRVQVAPGTVELIFSESFYFGPESDWEVNGTLEIWSKNIWIAPTAKLHGTGKLIIHNPGDNVYYEDWSDSPTYIDGNNGLPIELDIELRNPYNLILRDMDDPGFGTANPGNSRAAALSLAGSFTFAVDGGDILLNGHDLLLGSESQLAGYNSSRMIVTGNSIIGHVIKEYTNTHPFVFPVGIAEGDYTPATLSPQSVSTLYVSVQDYAASGAVLEDEERGMDRIWHIFADEGVRTAFTLQHNSITNGLAYVDAEARIVQYAGSGNWIGDVTTLDGEGIHTRADILAATADTAGSFITKYVFAEDVPPVANDDYATVESRATVQITVLGNDEPGSSPIVVGSVRIIRHPANGVVIVNSDGSTTYTPNPGFVGEDSFEYEVTDENSLTDTATVYITVTPRGLRIPNTFTPNGDGINDVFEIEGIEGFDRVEVTIINRWGNEVYRNVNYQNDWGGGDLSQGTYYYQITTYKGADTRVYTSWLLLKRY